MRIPFFQVDAFTDHPFAGNPAAVCLLERWPADDALLAVAAENNLSETAFLVPLADADVDYHLRWFTPAVEVDLCGHATLASAWVVLHRLEAARKAVTFRTKSGRLRVERDPDTGAGATGRLAMDFPSRPPTGERAIDRGVLAEALGREPIRVLAARDQIAVFERESEVAALAPDMARVAALDCFSVVATAPADGPRPGELSEDPVDFVSRFFAPAVGVPEDPVTGSAHSSLVPYWADVLGRTALRARQISARGGDLWCRLQGDRVRIAGHAVLVIEGTLALPPIAFAGPPEPSASRETGAAS